MIHFLFYTILLKEARNLVFIIVDFQGKLKNGNIAAIKVLSAESRQGVREFVTEIKVISEIEHENLVKLYGCCVEDNHRILVYNYLENNSLAQTLLGKNILFSFYCWKFSLLRLFFKSQSSSSILELYSTRGHF